MAILTLQLVSFDFFGGLPFLSFYMVVNILDFFTVVTWISYASPNDYVTVVLQILDSGEQIGLKHFRPVKPLGSGDTGRFFFFLFLFFTTQHFMNSHFFFNKWLHCSNHYQFTIYQIILTTKFLSIDGWFLTRKSNIVISLKWNFCIYKRLLDEFVYSMNYKTLIRILHLIWVIWSFSPYHFFLSKSSTFGSDAIVWLVYRLSVCIWWSYVEPVNILQWRLWKRMLFSIVTRCRMWSFDMPLFSFYC